MAIVIHGRQPVKRAVAKRITERGGFDQALFCKICRQLCLRLKSSDDRELSRLIDVLFLHGFLPSRHPF